jgi:hypothetical protein
VTAFNKNIRRFALSRTWPGASLTINSNNSPFFKIKTRMFFRSALLILVIAFLGSCSEIREIRAEETAVRQVFEDYKTAVLEMNGSESVRYLTRNSLDFYDDMVNAAKYMYPNALMRLSEFEQLSILLIRHSFVPKVLIEMDGTGFFILSTDAGVSSSKLEDIEIRRIQFDGDDAYAEVLFQGEPTDFLYTFNKSSGAWLLDITSGLELMDEILVQMRNMSNISFETMVVFSLESLTGRPVSAEIWYPPFEDPGANN